MSYGKFGVFDLFGGVNRCSSVGSSVSVVSSVMNILMFVISLSLDML